MSRAREDLGPGDESAEPIVVHPRPVRIPAGALPETLRPPSPSRFGPAFMIGASAAPWIAVAVVSGESVPVLFALAWLALLAVDLVLSWRGS